MAHPGPSRAARLAAGPAVLLAGAFGMTLLLARSVIQSDEGYTLNAAWQVWTGLRMYDDFRLFVGPGSGYAVAAIWKLVGAPSFLAARLLSLAFSFGATTGMVLLLRRLRVRGVPLATGVIAWVSLSSLYVLLNHNSFSSDLAVWFLLAFLRVVAARSDGSASRPPRWRDHALVGATAGLVFLFLPMKGAILAATAAVFLLATELPGRRARAALAVAGGFLAVIGPLFLAWSPATLLRQWVLIPLAGQYLGHTSASPPFVMLALAVVSVMGVVALRFRDRVLQALTCTQAALMLAIGHNAEASHVAINLFPAVVFAVFLLHDRYVAPRNERPVPAPALLLGFFGLLVVWTIATPAGRARFETSVLDADLVHRGPKITVPPRVAQAHAIYAGPFMPGLYYLFGKKNPFFVSETVVCNDECQNRLIAQLRAVKPELAFLDYEMVRHLHYPADRPVDVFLRETYVACPSAAVPVRAIAPSWCP